MKNTKSNFFNFPIQAFCLIAFVVLSSCSSKQQVRKEVRPTSTMVTYSKVRGRGMKKPLYTIELLDSKEVKYTGIANVPQIGVRINPITEKKYAVILKQFQAADFKAFKETYKSKMRDLPLSRIAFDGHTVTYQEAECPSELRVLVDLMEGLVN